jgi:hypothetical protein
VVVLVPLVSNQVLAGDVYMSLLLLRLFWLLIEEGKPTNSIVQQFR